MSEQNQAYKPQKCSWSYLCEFYPKNPDDEEAEELEVIEERDKFENVVWTDKEFVDNVRSKCPNCGLLDRLLLCLCGKCKLKRTFSEIPHYFGLVDLFS